MGAIAMRWTATTIVMLVLLPMAGQQAAAENEPKVITLSCVGTTADTSSSTVPGDHQPKPIEKLRVVVNLNARTVSFMGWNIPIRTVDAASISFNGNDVRPSGQIADKTGNTSKVDGILDRVTGHMVADTMTYATKKLSDPTSAIVRDQFDVLCKATNRVF